MGLLGKSLILMGLVLVVAGTLIWASASIPFLGRLPGDIYIKRGNFTFYFPITTCIAVSVLLSLLFVALRR